jgi:YhcH/YjgK/YiaL family protein
VDGTQKPGRHDIDGDHCFALVQTHETKPVGKALVEAHRKRIDVQFIHSGRETILWAPLETMRGETMAHSGEKDAAPAMVAVRMRGSSARIPPGTESHEDFPRLADDES